jgi:hypothetical protein
LVESGLFSNYCLGAGSEDGSLVLTSGSLLKSIQFTLPDASHH